MVIAVPVTTCSWGLLLNNNNTKLANKEISDNKPIVSHKLGDNGRGFAVRSNNNNIKLINNVSTKKLKVSSKMGSGSSGHNSGAINRRFNIAIVKPTFTAAAYNNAFYKFYFLFIHTPVGTNVTTHLSLLSSKIPKQLTTLSSSAFTMFFLPQHLKLLLPKSNINVLTDADVDSGSAIFVKNGITKNRYDILIIGHQEYVTQREYDNLNQFVANGGTLIVLDGNALYAQVNYNRNTNIITLVKGHGWAFNGKSAWRSVSERWKKETSDWTGSNYLCYSCKITFLNNPFGYKHHEEQYITHPKDRMLMNYDAAMLTSRKNYHPPVTRPVIATYQLNYKKGKVIVLGIYSDDIIISNSKFDKFLDELILQYAI